MYGGWRDKSQCNFYMLFKFCLFPYINDKLQIELRINSIALLLAPLSTTTSPSPSDSSPPAARHIQRYFYVLDSGLILVWEGSNGKFRGSSRDPGDEYTPTWVVAAIWTVFIVISLLAQLFLHYLGKTIVALKETIDTKGNVYFLSHQDKHDQHTVPHLHASVTKLDYGAWRSGFIMRHCSSNQNFDFHKNMVRILEDDFKVVVGTSWYLWHFVVIFLLDGTYIFGCLSYLLFGTKLEHIITRLAEEAAEKRTDDQEALQVKPSDHHFWFRLPGIVLYMINFILFQNAFELAFFFWVWTTYGFGSCIVEKLGYLVPRLVIRFPIQVLCSSSTLPLYTIVTGMGDVFKQAIFDEQ